MMHLESVQLKGGIFLPRLISASALPLRNWKHEKLRLFTCMFRSALLTNTLSTFKLSSLRPLNNKLPVKIESRLQNTTAAIFYKKNIIAIVMISTNQLSVSADSVGSCRLSFLTADNVG